jgi:hypothetical protein
MLAVVQYKDSRKENGPKLAVRDEKCDDLCLRRSWLLLSIMLGIFILTNGTATLV